MTGMYAQRALAKSGMARGLPIPGRPSHHGRVHALMPATQQDKSANGISATTHRGPHQRGFTEVAKNAPGNQYDRENKDGSYVYLTDLDGDYLAEFVNRNATRTTSSGQAKPFFLYFLPSPFTRTLRTRPSTIATEYPAAMEPPMKEPW